MALLEEACHEGKGLRSKKLKQGQCVTVTSLPLDPDVGLSAASPAPRLPAHHHASTIMIMSCISER